MTERRRLNNRRQCTTFNFECGPHHYTATVSYFPGTSDIAEIFLGNGRAGIDVDAAAKDSAVVASLLLQHSCDVDTIRKALLRDPRGVASSPLGVALDILAERHRWRELGCPIRRRHVRYVAREDNSDPMRRPRLLLRPPALMRRCGIRLYDGAI